MLDHGKPDSSPRLVIHQSISSNDQNGFAKDVRAGLTATPKTLKPKYLYDARGFDTKAVGYYAWIPYAAAGVGCLVGGWYSSWLLSRGHSLNFARKAALGGSAAVMPLIVFVTQSPVELAIVLFSIAFFGQQSWSTLVMILPTDLFSRRIVGSVAGLVGFGGAMGGVVFNLIAGGMLDRGQGYGVVFAVVSTLHVLAFGLILITIRKVHKL